ncbi:MAG: hypothetical protein PHE26_12295 [Syntrophomonadaceae bacterium]|nr:hypothetical protein [Syntrophomonadaceae bacterium]
MVTEGIYRLFEAIRDISREQLLIARSIDSQYDHADEMLFLFEQRQEVIKKIDKLSAQNPDCWMLITNSHMHDELINITKDIQECDQQSCNLIGSVSEQVGNKLINARNSMKAYDAYLPNNTCTEGWFFDRKK